MHDLEIKPALCWRAPLGRREAASWFRPGPLLGIAEWQRMPHSGGGEGRSLLGTDG